MKKIIAYQCEVCGQIYGKKSVALKCERRGSPEVLPRGLAWLDKSSCRLCVLKESRVHGHERVDVAWATPNINQEFGDYTLKFESGANPTEYREKWRKNYSWRHAIAFVRHYGIRPLILYKGRVITILEHAIMKAESSEK